MKNLIKIIALALTLQVSLFALGQESGNNNSARKRVEITRTELSPKLDGVLDDEIWKTATVISDLHQFKPLDQAPPSERSEFYITYNENYFYIAARLYHTNPEEISARQLIQGSGLGFDDSFEFILDTFNNRRTGYQFQTNPNGIRREGVFEGPDSINRDWSGIWFVEARIDEEGWTAEVAIPFNTVNFDPNSDEWGFSIARTLSRLNEDIAWSSFNRNVDPSTTGVIYGIRDINQGVGLDIIPSVSAVSNKNYITDESDSDIEPSVDIFYKFTPNLTGALTLNTDFSATEVDNRQVNLSRFSLFFPEKRDFFLQDVDIFAFGGRSGGGNFNNGGSNGIPFYSRRIGLSSSTGEPVPINAGVKLTGRVGDLNVGALVVQQDEYQNDAFNIDLGSQTVFVGRAAFNILSESTIGTIFTQGDPNSENDNSLAGVDFHYQKTRFSDSYSFKSDMWYQQSKTEGRDGDEKAFGINAKFDTQDNGISGSLSYEYFGEDYFPALGFANRVGIESYDFFTNGRYYLKDNPLIRNIFSFMRYGETRKLDTGKLQSGNFFWRMMNINSHRGDQVGFGVFRNKEGVESPFEIWPGVIIPAGDYAFSGFQFEAKVSNQRTFSPFFGLNTGEYYDGDKTQYNIGTEWRPDEHFFFRLQYNYQDISLPSGDFDVQLLSIKANYAFTSKWSWINLIQYDNRSNSTGVNSRLRWNPKAGEDLYLVVNYNFDTEETLSRFSQKSSELVLKYTKTFRY